MTRCVSAVGLAVAILSFAEAALAQGSTGKESGSALGARLGYALPMGKIGTSAATPTPASTANDNLPDAVTGMVSIWFDIGYRINPSFYVGAVFQYGFAFVNKDKRTACNQGVSCSANDITVGVNFHYHFLPAAQFDPWVGAGIGYENLGASLKGSLRGRPVDTSNSITGIQFLMLQAGGDFKASSDVAIGPFVGLSLGEFTGYSATDNPTGIALIGDLNDTGLHEWLTLGLRAQFNL